MLKEALQLLATAPVQAAPLQSLAEAQVGTLVGTLQEADLEALGELMEEALLEAPEQTLVDPPAEAPAKQQHDRLQAPVVQSLRVQTADLVEATLPKPRQVAELEEEVVQGQPQLEDRRKPQVTVPVGQPEAALPLAAFPVGSLAVQKISAEAPSLGDPQGVVIVAEVVLEVEVLSLVLLPAVAAPKVAAPFEVLASP